MNVPYSSDLAICASGAAEIVRNAWWSVVWTPAHLLPAACVEELLVHWIHDGNFVWRRVRRERVVLLLEDLLELPDELAAAAVALVDELLDRGRNRGKT